jgi:hypothetical protein
LTIVNQTLPGAQGRPLLATIQKEMPNDVGRRSNNNGGSNNGGCGGNNGGGGCGGGGGSGGGGSYGNEVSSQLSDLIQRMQASASNPDEAVEALHQFKVNLVWSNIHTCRRDENAEAADGWKRRCCCCWGVKAWPVLSVHFFAEIHRGW